VGKSFGDYLLNKGGDDDIDTTDDSFTLDVLDSKLRYLRIGSALIVVND
jgi:hypothetical protein